jgi:hypothetical protein
MCTKADISLMHLCLDSCVVWMTACRHSEKKLITPVVLQTYRRARDLYDNHDIQTWGQDGGRRGEFLDASSQLHALLNRAPWQADVLTVIDEDACPSYRTEETYDQGAKDIKIELDRLVSEV